MPHRLSARLLAMSLAAMLGLLAPTPASSSDKPHIAAPLAALPVLASFSPEEHWIGGTPQSLSAPWGDTTALALAADDGGAAVAEAPITTDLSNSNVRLVFYTDTADQLAELSVIFDVGSGDFTSTFRTDLTEVNVRPGNYVVNNGWNVIAKPRRFAYSPSNERPEAWANVHAIRLQLSARPGGSARVLFARLERLPAPARGVLTLSFDHVPAYVPKRIAPLLMAHGYAATVFVTPNWVGHSTDHAWASLDDLKDLAAHGWDVGLHAWDGHPDFTKLPIGQVRYQLTRGSEWLTENGFGSPLRLWASPEGTWSPEVVDVASEYVDACRCAGGWNTLPPEGRYLVRSLGALHRQSAEELLDMVRTTAREKEWFVLTFHYFDEGAYDFSYDSAELQRFLDGLAGIDVDVLPMSQVVQRLP